MSDRREIRKPASNKMLLIAQYWQGDRTQMKGLLKLIADMEPEGASSIADLVIVNRFDAEPLEPAALHYLARKFHVFTHKSLRQGTGWPVGCNSLTFGALEWFYSMSAERLGIPRYKAGFLLEADCCPLNRDWLRIFDNAWNRLRGRACIAGCQVEGPSIARHINGNMFVSGNLRFLHWLARKVNENGTGWDYGLAEDFRKWGAAVMPGMAFRWRTPTLSEAELQSIQDSGIVWLHGVKDLSAQAFARKKLLT